MANKISLEIPDDSSLEAGYIVKYDGADWVTLAPVSISEETGSYILATGDAGKTIEMNVASANSVTVPPESSVDFPVGTEVFITQTGTGLTSLVAGAGVTINSLSGLDLSGQWSSGRLIKRGSDIWVFVTEGAALELDPPTAPALPSPGDYVVGGYHDFDGTDERIDFGLIPALEFDASSTFTISLWAYKDSFVPGSVLLSYDLGNVSAGNGEGWIINWTSSYVFFGTRDGSQNTTSRGFFDPSLNTWHHIIFVFAAGTMTAYLNGASIFLSNLGGVPFQNIVYTNVTDLRIGSAQSGTYFPGRIAEVAVWSSDQSANVAAIYNSRARHNLMDLATPPDLFYAPLTIYGDDPGLGGSVAELAGNNDGTGVNMETADAVIPTPTTVTSTLTKALDIATSVVTTTKVEGVESGGGGTGSSFP